MIKRVLILSVCLTMMLSSCSTEQIEESNVTTTEEVVTTVTDVTTLDSITTETSEMLETGGALETEPTVYLTGRTQKDIDAAWELRHQNKDDDFDVTAVRIVDGIITVSDKYPELKEVVEGIVAEHETLAQQYEDWNIGEYRITRFDDKCLSFIHLGSNYEKDGGYSQKTYNFRLDGTEIYLDDVVNNIVSYCMVGAELIDSYNPECHLSYFHEKSTYEQLIDMFTSDKAVYHPWCMNEGAIYFYADYNWVGIPYRQTADLLNPEFLPDDGLCYGITNYGIIEYDDDVLVSVFADWCLSVYYPSINDVDINYVEELQEHGYSTESDGACECYPQYLRTDDGVYVFYYCWQRVDDLDIQFSALYDITDGTPVFLYGSNKKININDAEDLLELVESCT